MATQKSFTIKIPHELWLFVKKTAADKDTTMNNLLIELVKKAKERQDKKSIDSKS